MVEQNQKKCCRAKFLLGFIGSILIFLLIIWTSVFFWLGPHYVQTRITDDIAAFWEGQVVIDGIDFRLFDPIRVSSIVLENKMGKACVRAEEVTLLFKRWPSRDPQLNGIKLDRLDLSIQFQGGVADLPLRKTALSRNQ